MGIPTNVAEKHTRPAADDGLGGKTRSGLVPKLATLRVAEPSLPAPCYDFLASSFQCIDLDCMNGSAEV